MEEEVPVKAAADHARERHLMVDTQIHARGIGDARVLEAMRAVRRHEFVEPRLRERAYEDSPLPIAAGQTISQPYMVGAMCAALELQGHETVLDVGCGSGYQAAVLTHLAARVYSIEREPRLLETARATLARLGYLSPDRLVLVEGDGTLGYLAGAPYHGIVVGAGAPDVPAALIEQLADGGRLVIPVGDLSYQDLVLVRKAGGQVVRKTINACRFVPLVGAAGWKP
jgi:protein-L-isoaspartate(D-aspartate) O-methyltransferase